MTFEPAAGRDRSVVPLLLRARQLRSTEPVLGRTVGVLVVGLTVGLDMIDELPVYEELERVGVVTERVGVERVGVTRVGVERVGVERVGVERVGVAREGVERVGLWVERVGVDRTGVDRTGVDRTGVDRTGFWRLEEPARTGVLWPRLRWALALSAVNARENARARRRRGRWLNMRAFFLGESVGADNGGDAAEGPRGFGPCRSQDWCRTGRREANLPQMRHGVPKNVVGKPVFSFQGRPPSRELCPLRGTRSPLRGQDGG